MQKPGLFKRLVVIVYDGLLLTAVLFFTSALLMGVIFFLFKISAPDIFFINSGVDANSKLTTLSGLARLIGNIAVSLNCLVVSFIFYGWFWTHGGQTLGMKAWNLYLVHPDGKFISWQTAAVRYGCAFVSWLFLGLGFSWVLLNQQQKTWHDIVSNSQLVFQAPK